MEAIRAKSLEEYRKWFGDLRKNVYFGRLGKTFRTDDNFYFLDMGTGKIANIKEGVYQVLTCWFENDNFKSIYQLELTEEELLGCLDEIKSAVEQENILSAPILETMVGEATFKLEESLLEETSGVTLELTEDCNLRCTYCIYHPKHPGFREFGKKHMSIETAKQAVDFLFENSKPDAESLHVGFYGGEPLLNFDVMKETIVYAKGKLGNQAMTLGMTTNAVLLTPSVCDYLVENDVSVTISLDGPKEIHDKQRLFVDDTGSFDAVEKGVKTIMQSYERLNKTPDLLINMVIEETNSSETYELIHEFYEKCDWLPKDIPIRCNGVGVGPRKGPDILPHSQEQQEIFQKLKDPMGMWNDEKTSNHTKDENNFSKETIDQSLIRIHKRFLSDMPTVNYSLNGCCVPGQRKAYVTVNGDLYPCEQLGGQVPILGNVQVGYDIPKIKKYYVDDYIEKSKDKCQNCWAANLCGVCYSECYSEDGLVPEYKNMLCVITRCDLENSLVRYHRIFEKSPSTLEAFNEITIV